MSEPASLEPDHVTHRRPTLRSPEPAAGDSILSVLRKAFVLASELREARATLAERLLEIDALSHLVAVQERRLLEPSVTASKAAGSARSLSSLKRLLPASVRARLQRWRGVLSGAEREGRTAGSKKWTWKGSFDTSPGVARTTQTMTGWALHREQGLSHVELTLNGRPLGLARIGMARPDIARHFSERDAHVAGFQLVVDIAELTRPDEYIARLGAVVHTVDGGSFEFSSLDIPIKGGAPVARARTTAYHPVANSMTQARRVLVFTHSLGLGGAQVYLSELLRRLAEGWSWDITVVTPRDGVLRGELERAEIEVRVVPSYGEYEPQTHEALVCSLAADAREKGIDLVLANTMGAFIGVEVAARLRVPSLWMIHESFAPNVFWKVGFPHTLSELVRVRAEQALGLASLCVFPADATRRLYDGWIESSRSLLLPYGIDLAQWSTPPAGRREKVRARFGLPAGAFVIVSVATIEPRKGQTRIAMAFRDLMSSHPNARLVLVGEHEPESDFSVALRGFLARNAMQDHVLIRPLGDEVPDWHSAADLVVLASDIEALPICLIEAMASGVCVAAAEVFGVPALIRDGVEGFLFRPNDIASLRTTLDGVMRMEAPQRRLVAEAGQARAGSMDAGVYARDFVAAASSILGPGGGEPESPRFVGSPLLTDGRAAKLAFLHIPKAGGTYVDYYLGTHVLGPAGYAFYNAQGWGLDRDWTVEELDEIRLRRDPLAYVHNHAHGWSSAALRRFKADGWLTFSFVRHPGDQLCSYYFWRRAQIVAGVRDASLTNEEWDWVSDVSLDEFLRATLKGEMLSAAVAELDPSPWLETLDFCAEFNGETFGRFLLQHLGHQYRPVQPLNVSGNRGFRQSRALGEISEDVEKLLLDHYLFGRYLNISTRAPTVEV